MIEINSSLPAEFPNGKENEIENFADLILIHCPKFEMFSMDGVINELNLGREKDRQFNVICLEITNLLQEYKFIEHALNTSGYFKLAKNGKIAKSKGGYFKYFEFMKNKELESKIIAETYVNGDINGIYLSRSELKNATIKQQNVMPSNTPETKSSVQKILSNPWVLLVSGIAIEEVTLGRIYKYIFQLL